MQHRDHDVLELMSIETKGIKGSFVKIKGSNVNMRHFPTKLADVFGTGKNDWHML